MWSRREGVDEYEVLCERCGYHIDANGGAEVCPECGEPEKNSHWDARRGSAWQGKMSFRTWIGTNWRTLRHAGEQFRGVRIEVDKSRWLLVVNVAVAGTILASPWTGALVGDPARGLLNSGWLGDVKFALWTLAQSLVAAVLLGLLTWVEYQGIRFFGRQREWRITKAVAWTVCAHASVGWIVMAVMPMVVLAGFYTAQRFFGVAPNGTIDLGARFGQVSLNAAAQGGGLVMALVAGLLVFETLVYVGVRRCRFANRARAEGGRPSIPA